MLKKVEISKIRNLLENSPDKTGMELKNEIKNILGYDCTITKKDYHIPKENVESILGQVQTPKWVADIMSYFCIRSKNSSVFDPCFGKGVFLDSSYKRLIGIGADSHKAMKQIHGVEIDPSSFAEGLFNLMSENPEINEITPNFFVGDVFDFGYKKFDSIIMNPPYIRQEEISMSTHMHFDKSKLIAKISKISGAEYVSSKSNLYSYFVVYLSEMLEENGRMVVIIPKVWLDSDYGKGLQFFLLRNFNIEFIIDFAKDTFADALIEDCIVVLQRKSTPDKNFDTTFLHFEKKFEMNDLMIKISEGESDDNEIKILKVSRKKLQEDQKWGKFLHIPSTLSHVITSNHLIPLSRFAQVVRGTTTNWNKFFISKDCTFGSIEFPNNLTVDIVSTPKDLKSFNTVKNCQVSKMLALENARDARQKNQIEDYVKKMLGGSNIPTTVKYMIQNKPSSWHMQIKPKTGPIIFSYIIRKTKNFILNSMNYAIRDNFYIITPYKDVDTLVLFGVLNSSVVKILMEVTGRRYGNGLLKLQVYEMADLLIPDIKLMSKETKNKIKKHAKKLSSYDFEDPRTADAIRAINQQVSNFMEINFSADELYDIEKKMSDKRLGRINQKISSLKHSNYKATCG